MHPTVLKLLALATCVVAIVFYLAREADRHVAAHPHQLELSRLDTAHGTLYYVVVPKGLGYVVRPGVSDELITLETYQVLISSVELEGKPLPAVINAGFFDPLNHKTTSFVTLEGDLVLDPRENERLIENENLKPYLPRIFNRSEFRVYECAGDVRYDIAFHEAEVPKDCTLTDAVGGGPVLLPERTDLKEAFVDYDERGKRTRDPVGVDRRDARSAVGLTRSGDVILAVGARNPDKPEVGGFSLADMAEALKSLGAVHALNLDGGGSSGMMFRGEAFYGKFNTEGDPIRRPVKSFLMVLPE